MTIEQGKGVYAVRQCYSTSVSYPATLRTFHTHALGLPVVRVGLGTTSKLVNFGGGSPSTVLLVVLSCDDFPHRSYVA
jgi:hypothetical protein